MVVTKPSVEIDPIIDRFPLENWYFTLIIVVIWNDFMRELDYCRMRPRHLLCLPVAVLVLVFCVS